MARLILIVFHASLFACSVENRETSSQDSITAESTSAIDTTVSPGNKVDELGDNTVTIQDTSRLTAVFDEQLTKATNEESQYYIVTITVSQYEGASDMTWRFDKNLAPGYFKKTWSMEGNEGSTELIIENNAVVCSFESDNHGEDKWCAQTGGVRSTWTEGETEVTLLDPNYGTESTQEFKDNLAILVNILKDGTITSEGPDSYVVRIESTVDVGQEVTEFTQVDIPKVIYDELVR